MDDSALAPLAMTHAAALVALAHGWTAERAAETATRNAEQCFRGFTRDGAKSGAAAGSVLRFRLAAVSGDACAASILWEETQTGERARAEADAKNRVRGRRWQK